MSVRYNQGRNTLTMRIPFARLALASIVALALSACGGGASAPTATPPPTATPAPTATPVPTATPAPVLDAKEAITTAFTKVKTATAYKVAVSFKAKGNLGDGMPGGGNPDEEVELLSMEGSIDGKDSQIALKGIFSALLGGDPQTGVEFLSVDGKNYIKGPVPLLNAPEAKWYILPEGETSPASGFSSDQLLSSLDESKFDVTGFKVDGTEQLDGKACTIYFGDKSAVEKAFQNSEGSALPTGQFKELERAEMRFWICEDGYFRKMTLDMEGIAEGQTEKATIKLDFRLSDFDGDISIEAPADAVPIPTPSN
jgi:hypothetical protein